MLSVIIFQLLNLTLYEKAFCPPIWVSIVILFLAFSGCKEEDNFIEIKSPVENTQLSPSDSNFSPTSGHVSFRSGDDCEAYEEFVDAFCTTTKAEAPPPPIAIPTEPPVNPVLYSDAKIKLLVNNDVIHATPMRNMENEIDFVIEMDGQTFILTKTQNTLVTTTAEIEIPAYLNSLHLIRDDFLYNDASVETLTSLLEDGGQATKDENGKLVLTIDHPELVPDTGFGDAFGVFGCDWEKAATIKKYLKNIGWSSDLELYETYFLFLELALDDCAWECGECTSPQCVFDALSGLPFSPEEIVQLESTFLRYSLGLTDDDLTLLQASENAEIKEKLAALMSGTDDFCRKNEVANEIVDLLEDGVLQDACNSELTPQEMLLSVMDESGFEDFDLNEFYGVLGDDYDFIKLDLSFTENGKLACIWQKFNDIDNYFLCELAMNFFGETYFDLWMRVEPFYGDDANARTRLHKSDGIILMALNKEYIENGCEIKIMKTLLHEIVHAELYRVVNDPSIDENNFPEIYEAYRQAQGWQHEYMSLWFREKLENALRDIYGDGYSNEEYEALAWEGLDEIQVTELDGSITYYYQTQAWEDLPESEKQQIRNIQNQLDENCDESCD